MEWGHFLQVIGSIFATAGLVMLMVFKYVIEAAVPSMVMASFGLGLGVLLGGPIAGYPFVLVFVPEPEPAVL